MKPKFKTYNKGVITQYFGGSPANNPTQYSTRGQSGHSGIDTDFTIWAHPVEADNDCYVYKTINSNQSRENWQGVYMLVEMPNDEVMEICQGHFEEIKVRKGDYIPEGAIIGLEGNRGYVFSGGVQITPEMQMNGDKRGAHTHTAFRLTKKVPTVSRDEYYLLNVDGTKYRHTDGSYLQIVYKDNGYNGCINPWLYAQKEPVKKNNKELLAKIEVLKAEIERRQKLSLIERIKELLGLLKKK